jgi:hypothetical protein
MGGLPRSAALFRFEGRDGRIDFKTIAEWLGHQDGGVLLCKVYSHLLDGHKRDMAAKLVFSPCVVTDAGPTGTNESLTSAAA